MEDQQRDSTGRPPEYTNPPWAPQPAPAYGAQPSYPAQVPPPAVQPGHAPAPYGQPLPMHATGAYPVAALPYGQPGYPGQPYPGVPAVGLPVPVAVNPVPGTPFSVAIVAVPTRQSGPASGSLVAGVGSILVAGIVGCFGALGAKDGWGPLVAGAFALLAAFAGIAAVALGQAGLRQVRRGGGQVTGRGLAIGGLACGASGIVLTAIIFVVSLAAAQG